MSVENFTDPEKWALQQWGDVDLGDSRRTNRAVEVGSALAQNPGASLPAQMESWNQRWSCLPTTRGRGGNSHSIESTPLAKHSVPS